SKQAKNEESTRPKSKFFELKPFESSSSSNPSTNLELETPTFKEYVYFPKIYAAVDHSMSLVEIAEQLGDPPFGRFHRRHALSFSIVVFGSLGNILQLRGTSRRYHTGAKGEGKTLLAIRRMGSAILRSLFLCSFSCLYSFLLNNVHAFP
ncbi:hypothetical protein H5410_003266, partial [Solanum commersonii]